MVFELVIFIFGRNTEKMIRVKHNPTLISKIYTDFNFEKE
jgi:hypothetical protein